jgi:hypothetical protein
VELSRVAPRGVAMGRQPRSVRVMDIAQTLGLYCTFWPGPYIGAEWDGGVVPGWLAIKSGMANRANRPTGPAILMQLENEYGYYRNAQEHCCMDHLSWALREVLNALRIRRHHA